MFEVGQRVRVKQLFDEDLIDEEIRSNYQVRIGEEGEVAGIDNDLMGVTKHQWYMVRFGDHHVLEFVFDELELADDGA